MKVIRKYTAIQVGTENVNQNIKVKLSYGSIEGPHYNQTHPKEEFDTEDEAIEYAYKWYKYGTWLILPIITFDTFDEK